MQDDSCICFEFSRKKSPKRIYYKMKEELYMSDKMKKGIRKAAFILGGMALGLAYYYFVGCKTGG